MVDVSIILITWSPTPNRFKLLKQTLESLRTTTEVPYEIIVIDNGPKEQTEFLKTQKIDKHIINEINMGIGYARNQGMKVATGKYLCFLDNDIEFKKGWLEESLEAIEKYSEDKLIVNPIYSFASKNGKSRIYLGEFHEYPLWYRTYENCWIGKREVFDEVGDWKVGISTESRDYVLRAIQKNCKFIGLPVEKAHHRGLVKTYNFKMKLIRGKWISHGREYWDRYWTKKWKSTLTSFLDVYTEVRKHLKGRIADVACGVSPLYLEGNYNVTGLDISSVAIKKSKELYPKGKFRFGRATRTGLPSGKFDTVVLSHIIEHYGDFNPILLEAKRICRVGGNILILVPIKCFHPDHVHPCWNEEKIKKEIEPVLGNVTFNKLRKCWFIKYEKT